MRQLTSLRSLVVKQVTFYKIIWCFQKWLRHFRAKISLFDKGAGAYLFREFREAIQLCCIWCWPPDMHTAQHKTSSCTSENVTQSTQCSGNHVLYPSPGSVSTNLQRADRFCSALKGGLASVRGQIIRRHLLLDYIVQQTEHWDCLNCEKLGVLILHMEEAAGFFLGPSSRALQQSRSSASPFTDQTRIEQMLWPDRPLVLQNNSDQSEVAVACFLLCSASAGHRVHAQKYKNYVDCSEASWAMTGFQCVVMPQHKVIN